MFFKSVTAQQPAVTLAWSPNLEANLSHYVMYRDTIPGTMKYLEVIAKTDTIYVDMAVVTGKTYYYKLTATDSNGYESAASNEVSTTVGTLTLNEGQNNAIGDFELFQNYPNPFNPTTNIPYALTKNSKVTITVYDVLGNEIRKLVDEFKAAGNYETVWDAKNNNGRRVSSGTYFYRMAAQNYAEVKKLILQK